MTIESNIEISQPPSVVYQFLIDEENLSLWVSNFVRLERLSGENGEAGSTAKHFYFENSRTIEMREEILQTVENEQLISMLYGESFDMKVTNILTPIEADEATRLAVAIQLTPRNFLAKLTLPIIRNKIEKRAVADLQKLKDAIEELTDIDSELDAE
ncbi:MAG: SRPBCC family protein [Saprospiraceae bacterium]|nr:SRPBCC family protein [Saprospiraceae bacterium]